MDRSSCDVIADSGCLILSPLFFFFCINNFFSRRSALQTPLQTASTLFRGKIIDKGDGCAAGCLEGANKKDTGRQVQKGVVALVLVGNTVPDFGSRPGWYRKSGKRDTVSGRRQMMLIASFLHRLYASPAICFAPSCMYCTPLPDCTMRVIIIIDYCCCRR